MLGWLLVYFFFAYRDLWRVDDAARIDEYRFTFKRIDHFDKCIWA